MFYLFVCLFNIFIFVFVCVFGYPRRPEEDFSSPGARFAAGCESPDVSAEN